MEQVGNNSSSLHFSSLTLITNDNSLTLCVSCLETFDLHDFIYCIVQINTLIIQINDRTKTSTKFSRATLHFGLIALMVLIVAAAPVITFAQQAHNATQNTTQGFGGSPSGPLTAIRHVFDDPTLRVWHFCKPNDKIMMVCQLYDSNSPNATLIGVEYMITTDAYKNLPDREKPNWHYHKEEFAPNRANPKFPQLSEQQQNATLKKLAESYGKVIITWNPNDKAPVFPPQVEQVQHPFMVNTTVTSETETQSGTFNQTLKY